MMPLDTPENKGGGRPSLTRHRKPKEPSVATLATHLSDGDTTTPASCWDQNDPESAFRRETEREIFQKARFYLHPGPLFRLVVKIYSERKLLVFYWAHFVASVIVAVHFFLIKLQDQKEDVAEDANRFWWKRIVPALEFGAMHSILFQLGLIPLTMARLTLSTLSQTVVNRFVPFGRAVQMHVYLGYTVIVVVVAAVLLMLAFFGILCNDGEQKACDKFTSEIMTTGYAILGILLAVLVTSFSRHRLPYEVFYFVHQLVFAMYVVLIFHTFDTVQRSGDRQRSQTFKWVTASLMYYICDRTAMRLNHTFRTHVLSTSAISGSNGSKMIVIKMRRPVLFQFQPGQYAYLRMPEIDRHWHPYSIASGPASEYLEFYVEVFNPTSWTARLWSIVDGDGEGGIKQKQVSMDVMGPYGTPLAKANDYTHMLAIGSGTGIVPILSLFQQHVDYLLRLDPQTYLRELEWQQRQIFRLERADEPRKGSLGSKIFGAFCQSARQRESASDFLGTRGDMLARALQIRILHHNDLSQRNEVQMNFKAIRRAARSATSSMIGVVLLTVLPVIGVAMIGLTISWNTIPIEVSTAQTDLLSGLTVVFQLVFFLISVFIWDGNNIFSYLDLVFCIASPIYDVFLVDRYETHGILRTSDMFLYGLLIGYMTARLWNRSVRPRHRSWRDKIIQGMTSLDRLEIVWTTRSASLVSEIMPNISEIWNTLVAAWGKENANRICSVHIFVTDPNEHACSLLRQELSQTDIFKSGNVVFERPDLATWIEDHTLNVITNRRNSYSLLAFCGNSQLAAELHSLKISNDMVTAITGNEKHQMEFVSESYGGIKVPENLKRRNYCYPPEDTENSQDGLTTRQESLFFGGRIHNS